MDDEARALLAAPHRFEWDERKRLSNIEKHGIDFIRASHAFMDSAARTYVARGSRSELRYLTIGKAAGVLMAVVWTPRPPNIRIISARSTRRKERSPHG